MLLLTIQNSPALINLAAVSFTSLLDFATFSVEGRTQILTVLARVPRIHKGEEKVVCCFGGFCVRFGGFLFSVFFSLCCCVCVQLSAHPWVTWSLPLCCFEIISSLYGNCEMRLSRFQSNLDQVVGTHTAEVFLLQAKQMAFFLFKRNQAVEIRSAELSKNGHQWR